MATEKAPTKAEFMEALSKKGINNLDDLMDAIMPETGGFSYEDWIEAAGQPANALARFFSFGMGSLDDRGQPARSQDYPIPGLR